MSCLNSTVMRSLNARAEIESDILLSSVIVHVKNESSIRRNDRKVVDLYAHGLD